MLTSLVMWAVTPLFIKYFTQFYSPWTQNAFRYTFAAVFLLVIAFFRGDLAYRLSGAQKRKLAFVAIANILMQVCYVGIYYFIFPAVASLVGRINIVFVTVLSFLIFHDERGVIRSPRFLAGSSLALTGVAFVILGKDPHLLATLQVTERNFWIGVGLSVTHAFLLSVYFLTIKHAVSDIPPIVSFTHVSWITAGVLCVPGLAVGGVGELLHQPWLALCLMALSALMGITIAHSCYYAALREIKAVVTTSMMQVIPVLTCSLSALLYGDRLTGVQILGGGAVIFGAWLATLAQAGKQTVHECGEPPD